MDFCQLLAKFVWYVPWRYQSLYMKRHTFYIHLRYKEWYNLSEIPNAYLFNFAVCSVLHNLAVVTKCCYSISISSSSSSSSSGSSISPRMVPRACTKFDLYSTLVIACVVSLDTPNILMASYVTIWVLGGVVSMNLKLLATVSSYDDTQNNPFCKSIKVW